MIENSIWMCVAILVIVLAIVIPLNWTSLKDYTLNPLEYRNKGSTGERGAYLKLLKFGLPGKQIFQNIYIRGARHDLTEIDLIAVSSKGIFVFEVKNYRGNVYGDASKQKWIQYIGKQKHYFLNPLLQNNGHIKAVRHLFKEYLDLNIIPVVIATNNSNWKISGLSEKDNIIMNWGFDVDFPKIYSSCEECLDSSEINVICEILKKHERPDKSVRDEHLRNVRKYRSKI